MKFTRYLFVGLFLVFSSISIVKAQDLQNQLQVGTVIGDVQYKPAEVAEWKALQYEMKVSENTEIRVNGKSASVILTFQDGSEIKLMGLTSVRVKEILKANGSKKRNLIKLLAGKLFAKVKQSDAQDFNVETQTAIAAVRGTEFGVSYLAGEQSGNVVVINGSVEVSDPNGEFPPVTLRQGQFSAFEPGAAFTPPAIAPDELFASFGQEPVELATEPVAKVEEKPEETVPTPIVVPDTTVPTDDDKKDDDEKPPLKDKKGECGGSGFNWSISSAMIDEVIWNRVLLSPTIKTKNFAISFYLPVYFQDFDGVFSPTKWYNYDEWNFGTSTNDAPYEWQDIFHDLLLKIKYMSFKIDKSAKGGKDAKAKKLVFDTTLGSIPQMSIGHGFIVDKYANDIEFPSVRKVGLQLNMDFGYFGFETMVGDLYLPEVIALRLFTRPFFGKKLVGKMGIGISSFFDFDPQNNGKSKVWGYDVDLELLDFDWKVFSMLFYGDLATLGYNDGISTTNYMQGYGFSVGIRGKIIIIDYRIEIRSINDGFIASYVDPFYDVQRSANFSQLLANAASFAANPGLTPDYNGFLISAGKNFENIGGITLAFEQLFPSYDIASGTLPDLAPNNTLHIGIFVDKCLFKKAFGSISYDRKNFKAEDFFTKFLADAVVSASIYYEITDGAYVGMTYKRFYDKDGNSKDTYGLETQLGL